MTDGLSPFDVKGVLGELAELGTVVVSCRTADFEQYLASYVAESVDFSSVWRLEPWRHNVEFANFIQILETRGVVKESELLEVVDSTPALQELVSCPLFARMLTLVGAQHASDVSDVTSLYRRFFEKLSVAADNALVEAGCHLPMTSMELWQDVAWLTFGNGLLLDEAINMTALQSLLKGHGPRPCVQRSIATIVDYDPEYEQGRFVHYSFFHFLLAVGIEELMRKRRSHTEELRDVLSRDLPRPVRHFLVDVLSQRGDAAMLKGLIEVYRDLHRTYEDGKFAEDALVGCNLIAYIVSRAFGSNGESALRDLLREEREPFLTNSLRWGLCHTGAMDVAAQFIESLDESAAYAAMCRGYLLYYHGDLNRETRPPFYDDDRDVPWVRTKAAVLELMADSKYLSDVPSARVVIDMYTFFSFALYRGALLLPTQCEVVGSVLGALWADMSVPDGICFRLMSMHASVCGIAVSE